MPSGGKRTGAGRKVGSKGIDHALREQFKEHTQTALDGIVAVATDKTHQHHLKACEIILKRGYGEPSNADSVDIIDAFLGGEISAIKAGLLLESRGLKVGEMLNKYIMRELLVIRDSERTFGKSEPLPIPE